MIYFVSNNSNYKTSINSEVFPDIKVLSEEEARPLYYKLLGKKRILALDLEATGLDPYLSEPLLYGIGTKKIQFMFDYTVDLTEYFKHHKKYKTIFLGHNLKYDIKLISTNYNILFYRLYDTMIAEQRLWMKSGYRFGYADLVERYLKKVIFKSTRNEFIGVKKETFRINPSHLKYLKGDLVDLFDIKMYQKQYIKKFKQELLIYGIEFPLIPIIAKAELEGFNLDTELWLARLEKEKEEQFKLKLELDAEVRALRDTISFNKAFKKIDPKISLGGNKYNNIRIHNPLYDIFKSDGTTTITNVFGEAMSHKELTGLKKKVKVNPNSIDWNSKKEIVYIFAYLEQPLITTNEDFSIPQIGKTGKLIEPLNKYTLKEDFLLKYLLVKNNSIMKNLIEMLIRHSKLEKSITTYGENFINKLNPKTGKLHTIFRQCDADTGRYQSGGGKKEPDKPNFQNIPAKLEYRRCFTFDTKNYSVITADYSGAELIVMASHAQDQRLLELSEQDMHSYMATRCWRNIFGSRANSLLKLFKLNPSNKTSENIIEYQKNVHLYNTYTITKEQKKERTEFKPMTFGTIYGMYPKKAGAQLNIIPEEGKIVIETIERELPRTFAMVKQASLDAERQGFVVLNTRTNSRAWFPNLIRLLKGQISKQTHFLDISTELSAARNIRIQGTQADFVKEASVVLDKYCRKNNLPIMIVSWVHDEFVIKCAKYLDGKSQQWIDFISYFPNFTLTSPITGKEYDNAKDLIADIMEGVANRYLINVKIKVEIEVENHWVK